MVSKSLANAEDQNKIPDDRNEKEIHVNHKCGLANDGRNLSLEAFESQLQTLTKKVDENESALKNVLNELAEKHICAEDQNMGSELTCLREENNMLRNENLRLKNENNDLIERTNNLSSILADLQGKTKNAEQERDSMITAMRLLVAESNAAIEKSQSPNHNHDTEQSGPNGAD